MEIPRYIAKEIAHELGHIALNLVPNDPMQARAIMVEKEKLDNAIREDEDLERRYNAERDRLDALAVTAEARRKRIK